MTRRPSSTRNATVSSIIRRFSSPLTRSARSTCRMSDLATSVMIGASESSSALTCGSFAAVVPARRVIPKAANWAFSNVSSLWTSAKNSVSLGTAPGQPPSITPTPSWSSRAAIAILSATERFMPSCWAPSRSVVSYISTVRSAMVVSSVQECSALPSSQQKSPPRRREAARRESRRATE